MKEELIQFETAKLAKEKGFNKFWNGTQGYYKGNLQKYVVEYCYPAPTQSLLQKWLREEHDLILIPDYDVNKGKYFFWIMLQDDGSRFHTKGHDEREYFYTYELALEKGLQEALKLINK